MKAGEKERRSKSCKHGRACVSVSEHINCVLDWASRIQPVLTNDTITPWLATESLQLPGHNRDIGIHKQSQGGKDSGSVGCCMCILSSHLEWS